MSADHPFKAPIGSRHEKCIQGWIGVGKLPCGKYRFEHDDPGITDEPEHPPAQVVQEAKLIATIVYDRKNRTSHVERPTDPARKPADEDEAAAREVVEAVQMFKRLGWDFAESAIPALTEMFARFREKGRQAGAEEMREACANEIERGTRDPRFVSKATPETERALSMLTKLAAAIRALPIPEPRS